MSDIDEIKQRVDIVDLISQYVALRKAGRAYQALCPFHTEKTPSFHVDPARQTWHCFGACGTGGDIFSFIMRKESVDFREALRILGERAGIDVSRKRGGGEDLRKVRIFEVNEAAAAFFASNLESESSGADIARAYLGERRVAPESIRRFQIGYAANAWDALLTHLSSRGYSADDALAAGLAIQGERGAYDRFRHRLMFAIRDERGRVAGFGGRVLDGAAVGSGSGQQPKYINTSQTVVFDKSAILYGLDLARDAIRESGRCVIVEGYMDAIAAHEHGYANVVASMGTALTEKQVLLIKRFTRNLVLALDADAAGSEGMLRGFDAIDHAVEHAQVPVPTWRGVIRMQTTLDADVRVIVMEPGHDPDDVIRNDPERWPRLVDSAIPFLDFRFDAIVARHDLSDARGRSAVVSALAPMIAAIPDRVMQAHYVQRLARTALIDEAAVRMELKPVKQQIQDRSREVVSSRVEAVRDKREEFCLALLFRYPAATPEGLELDPNLFGHSENRALFEAWAGGAESGSNFEESLTPDLQSQYERILSISLPVYEDESALKALRTTVWGIEQQRWQFAKRASAAMMAELSADNESVAQQALTAWQQGTPSDATTQDSDAEAVATFIEDMNTGLKVHRRILEQRRNVENPAGEVNP